jgi:voltage-gated potassium channel Kch
MPYRTCTVTDYVLRNSETFPVYNGVIDHKSLCHWFGSIPGYDVFKAAKMATATQLVLLGDAKQMRVLTQAGFDLTFN